MEKLNGHEKLSDDDGKKVHHDQALKWYAAATCYILGAKMSPNPYSMVGHAVGVRDIIGEKKSRHWITLTDWFAKFDIPLTSASADCTNINE